MLSVVLHSICWINFSFFRLFQTDFYCFEYLIICLLKKWIKAARYKDDSWNFDWVQKLLQNKHNTRRSFVFITYLRKIKCFICLRNSYNNRPARDFELPKLLSMPRTIECVRNEMIYQINRMFIDKTQIPITSILSKICDYHVTLPFDRTESRFEMC